MLGNDSKIIYLLLSNLVDQMRQNPEYFVTSFAYQFVCSHPRPFGHPCVFG